MKTQWVEQCFERCSLSRKLSLMIRWSTVLSYDSAIHLHPVCCSARATPLPNLPVSLNFPSTKNPSHGPPSASYMNRDVWGFLAKTFNPVSSRDLRQKGSLVVEGSELVWRLCIRHKMHIKSATSVASFARGCRSQDATLKSEMPNPTSQCGRYLGGKSLFCSWPWARETVQEAMLRDPSNLNWSSVEKSKGWASPHDFLVPSILVSFPGLDVSGLDASSGKLKFRRMAAWFKVRRLLPAPRKQVRLVWGDWPNCAPEKTHPKPR